MSRIRSSDPGCRGEHLVQTWSLTAYRPLLSPFACEADSRTMSPPTREDTQHLGAGSRYGPTPAAADGRADRPPPATAPRAQERQWLPTPDPGARPHV
jgi:hypothetical protein